MRFSFAVAVLVAGISLSGFAQQTTPKITAPDTEKAPKSAPMVKMPPTTSAINANQLKAIERQTAKESATGSAGKQTSGKAVAYKPMKDKPNPPMNFGGTGGKTIGTTSHRSTYNGRLKQKGGTGHQ
ncbi:MAG: hypothetical protein WB566_16980 [Terriglobales bacterium]